MEVSVGSSLPRILMVGDISASEGQPEWTNERGVHNGGEERKVRAELPIFQPSSVARTVQ
jgi:hypothetical protein